MAIQNKHLPSLFRTLVGMGSYAFTRCALALILLWLILTPAAAQDVPAPITQLAVLTGHTDEVNDVAFSPDGRWLASASDDASLRLWNVESRALVDEYFQHALFVSGVAFAPGVDSPLTLATTSWDRTIVLWDVDAEGHATPRLTIDDFAGITDSPAFNSDGTQLAVAVGDGTAQIRNSADGSVIATFQLDGGFQVNDIAFSPAGDVLATGAGFPAESAQVWDVGAGDELLTLTGHSSWLTSLAFSPDGSLLATGSGDTTVRLWFMPGGESLNTIAIGDWIMDVAFSPDGSLLAVATLTGFTLWDISSTTSPTLFAGPDSYAGAVNTIAFSPDGSLLATGGADGTVILWEIDQ